MRRAALVHVHLQVREATDESAARARVVEVDVRDGDGVRALVAELFQQRVERRARPGVDEHAVDEPRADDVLDAEVADIDQAHATTRS